MTWSFILILLVIALFILPLLPGIMELIRPTDIEPLRVSQDYDSNPYHFAEGFRTFTNRSFTDIANAEPQNSSLPNGTKYQLIGDKAIPQAGSQGLILSAHPITLPSGETFDSEVYSKQNISTGERGQFRAIMAENTLNLRENSTVLRWAHSEGDMIVGRHAKLYGRATSKQSIILGDGVEFERLHAPIILSTTRTTLPDGVSTPELTELKELEDVKVQSGRRWVLKGHLNFPARHRFDGDIVTGTTATIGDWAHINGSLKINARDDAGYHLQSTGIAHRGDKKIARGEIGNHVTIDGSVVSSHDLIIGENCKILGPVIAEGLLIIGAGTVIGSPDTPTTVTATKIIIESGCIIYGTLWATEGGVVRMNSSAEAAA